MFIVLFYILGFRETFTETLPVPICTGDCKDDNYILKSLTSQPICPEFP